MRHADKEAELALLTESLRVFQDSTLKEAARAEAAEAELAQKEAYFKDRDANHIADKLSQLETIRTLKSELAVVRKALDMACEQDTWGSYHYIQAARAALEFRKRKR